MRTEDYPFVKEFLTDSEGKVRDVVLPLEAYKRLIEAFEDEGLYQAMQVVRNETPLSLEAAMKVLEADEG